MVSVKLPKSVLVVFHLWRATKLPNFFQVKSLSGLLTLNRVSSWCSVVRLLEWDKAASYPACQG
jgi:hypothetical protein